MAPEAEPEPSGLVEQAVQALVAHLEFGEADARRVTCAVALRLAEAVDRRGSAAAAGQLHIAVSHLVERPRTSLGTSWMTSAVGCTCGAWRAFSGTFSSLVTGRREMSRLYVCRRCGAMLRRRQSAPPAVSAAPRRSSRRVDAPRGTVDKHGRGDEERRPGYAPRRPTLFALSTPMVGPGSVWPDTRIVPVVRSDDPSNRGRWPRSVDPHGQALIGYFSTESAMRRSVRTIRASLSAMRFPARAAARSDIAFAAVADARASITALLARAAAAAASSAELGPGPAMCAGSRRRARDARLWPSYAITNGRFAVHARHREAPR